MTLAGGDYEWYQDATSATCASGYCNNFIGECGVRAALGEDCSSDTAYGCEAGMTCSTRSDGSQVCTLSASANARHRLRRRPQSPPQSAIRGKKTRRAPSPWQQDALACPFPLTACPTWPTGELECVDTAVSSLVLPPPAPRDFGSAEIARALWRLCWAPAERRLHAARTRRRGRVRRW